jgi:hypothetical protein
MATTTHEPTETEINEGAIEFLDRLASGLETLFSTTDPSDYAAMNAIRSVLGLVATERLALTEDRCPSCGQRHGDGEDDDEPETSSGKTVQ